MLITQLRSLAVHRLYHDICINTTALITPADPTAKWKPLSVGCTEGELVPYVVSARRDVSYHSRPFTVARAKNPCLNILHVIDVKLLAYHALFDPKLPPIQQLTQP
jgi:hypothetical protein